MDVGLIFALDFVMKNKPEVLMFGWELPPHNSGGLGVACYGLTKGLSRQGIPIAFALPRRLQIHVPFMKLLSHDFQDVSFTAIDSMLEAYMNESRYQTKLASLDQETLSLYGRTMYDEAQRYGEMAKSWSQRQSHNLIHAHDWMTYPAAINAKKVSGRPWVAHIHATEYDRTGGNVNSQIAEIEYQGLNQADQVIAVSNYTKDIVHRYYGVPSERISVVHNGIDLVDFQPLDIKRLFPKEKIVLFVGRLTYQKGVDYLLQAAKEALKENENTIFMIVGYGDMYQELIMKAASLGIAHKVVFPGFLGGDKLRSCYQMADVFVMPSISEPYGIVALEALATGTPAIISKQSGVSESLENVLKVDFWDTQKMARMINTLLSYPGLSKEIAQQAKLEARGLSWDLAAEKTTQVYNQVLA